MATPEEEQRINDILNERVGIEQELLSNQQDLSNVILDQVKNLSFSKVEQSSIRSITRDLAKTAQENYSVSLRELGTKKLTKKLEEDKERIGKRIQQLSQIEVKSLTNNKRLQAEIQGSINEQVESAKKQLVATTALADQSEKIGNNFGVDAFQGFSSLAQKIPGLGKFSKEFATAADTARISAAGGASSITAFGKGLASAAKSIGPLLLLTQLVSTLISLDKSSGEVAKNLGISYDEAIGLTEELSQSAEFSDNLFVNSANLLDAQVQISQVLGTNVKLNQDLLKSQVELTKQAGFSVEAATTLATLSLATGDSTDEITKSFLGQTVALNTQNNVQVNSKQLLESINKTSKGTLATFANQPKELAKAAFQARKLGLEISTLESMADGLLDIESSLTAEFEAEVISGRQLNLERARYFALTNDIAGVGREIEAQGITQESFAKATRIEQEALAKAVGLSRDQLGESLILRKGLVAAGMDNAEEAKKEFERLKAIGGEQYAINELGDTEYARQLASVSAQEKFAEVTNKLRDAFVSIAGPLLDIINPIVSILAPILTGIAATVGYIVEGFKAVAPALKVIGIILSPIIALIGALAVGSIVTAAYTALGGLPVVGPLLALAAIGFGVSKYKQATQSVKDGMAPSSKGPFTITDSFGATAITAQGDGLAVSPNIIREESINVTPNIIREENRNTTPSIDYDQLANAIAMGAEKGTSRANITTNLDGARVSNRLQPPLAVNTRKYSV